MVFESYEDVHGKLVTEFSIDDEILSTLSCTFAKVYSEGGEQGTKFCLEKINNEFDNLEKNKPVTLETQETDKAALKNYHDSWEGFIKNIEFLSAIETVISVGDVNKNHQENTELFFKKLQTYQKLSYGTKGSDLLKDFLTKLNDDDPLRFIYEIIQNADDCNYEKTPNFELDLTGFDEQRKITFTYNEIGMTYLDVISICSVGESTKKKRMEKRLTGEKGVGFKTIFTYCDRVDINSGGYVFQLGGDNNSMFFPIQLDEKPIDGTKITLYLKDKNIAQDKQDEYNIYQELKNYFGICDVNTKDYNQAFGSCAVLFTNQLTSIKVKKSDTESFEVSVDKQENVITHKVNGDATLNLKYFSQSFDVFLEYEEYEGRYPQGVYDTISKDEYDERKSKNDPMLNYPIVIVAPIFDGEITPDKITKGKMYSFLPTGTEISAPISIQLPVKLSQNRSTIDNDDLSWNDKMVEELQNFIPTFMENLRDKVGDNIFDYIPYLKGKESIFNIKDIDGNETPASGKLGAKYLEVFCNINYFGVDLTPLNTFMLDEFLNPYLENCRDIYIVENKTLIEYNKEILDVIFDKLDLNLQIKIKDDDRASKINNLLYNLNLNLNPNKTDLIKLIKTIVAKYYIKNDQGVTTKQDPKCITLPKEPENLKIYPSLNGKSTEPEKPENLKIYLSLNGKSIEYVAFNGNKWLSSDQSKAPWDYDELRIFDNDQKIGDYAIDLTVNIVEYDDEELKEFIKFCYRSSLENSIVDIKNEDLLEYINDVFTSKKELPIDGVDKIIANKIIGIYSENKDKFWLEVAIIAQTFIKKEEQPLELPTPSTWEESTCKWLNKTTFDKNLKPLFIAPIPTNNTEEPPEYQETINKALKDYGYENKNLNKINVYIVNGLKSNFVRYQNQVFLSDISFEIETECTNSIIDGLHYMVEFSNLKKTLETIDDDELPQTRLNRINNLTIGAFFYTIFISGMHNFKLDTSENNAKYELLQNANDYVSKRKISVTTSGESITLEYEEKKGFSLKDFYNIASFGNSESVNYVDKTGEFGTGFKSVYSKFQKVQIKSNGIFCSLDLTKNPNSIEAICADFLKTSKGNLIKFCHEKIEEAESQLSNDNQTLPIPIFKLDEAKNTTTIELTFRDNLEKLQLFVFDIEGVKDEDKEDAFFNQNPHLYFLHKIDTFNVDGVKYDKAEYLSNNFYLYKQENVEILFPKKFKGVIDQNAYVTLPLSAEEHFSSPFYINFLKAKTDENRKSLNSKDENFETFTNNFIDEFCKIFTQFATDNPTIAYKYFPYNWLDKFAENEGIINNLKSIPFLRVVKDSKEDDYELRSIENLNFKNILCKFQYDNLANFPWKDDNGFLFQYDNLANFPWKDDNGFLYYKDEKFYEKITCISFDVFSILILQTWMFSTNNVNDRPNQILEVTNIKDGTEEKVIEKVDFNQIPHYEQSSQIYKIYLKEEEKLPEDIGWTLIFDVFPSIFDTKIKYMDKENYKNITEYLLIYDTNIKDKHPYEYFENIETEFYKYTENTQNDENFQSIIYPTSLLTDLLTDLLNKLEEYDKEKIQDYYKLINRIAKTNITKNTSQNSIEKLIKNDKLPIGSVNPTLYSKRDFWYRSEISELSNSVESFLEPYWCDLINDELGKLINLDNVMEKGKFNNPPFNFNIEDKENIKFTNDIVSNYLAQNSFNWYWIWSESINQSENFLPYFKIYQEIVLSPLNNLKCVIKDKENDTNPKFNEKAPIFKFISAELSSLSETTKQFYRDLIADNPLMKSDVYTKFLTQILKVKEVPDLNTFEEILNDLLENRISVLKKQYNKNLWTLGSDGIANGKYKFILFNENALPNLLKYVFGCEGYGQVRNCIIYNSNIVNNVFKTDYDSPPADIFTEENVNKLSKLLDDINKSGTIFTQEKADKSAPSVLKKIWMEELQYEYNGTNYCFPGYGVLDSDEHLTCPLCKGKVLANATSMSFRHIIVFDKISTPVLFCKNCEVAAKYSTNYFAYKDGDRFKRYSIEDKNRLETDLKSGNELTICFDMNNLKPTSLSFKPTVLHRLAILHKLYKENPTVDETVEPLVNL